MDDRIQELEIKLSFQEDLLQTLNDEVVRQHRQIDVLQKQFSELLLHVRNLADKLPDTTPEQEIPPHY